MREGMVLQRDEMEGDEGTMEACGANVCLVARPGAEPDV
jgi:hypothetical protein